MSGQTCCALLTRDVEKDKNTVEEMLKKNNNGLKI
jgi:hypothetical protein